MLKDVLTITTAGSVDDGKSTLIARLLLDTRSIPEDQLGVTLGDDIDPTKIADLLDGLESEREQGITIDVAHRFFDSESRRYHLSDSPGHEQYTRNMATAAAGADALVLVIDASAGIKPQTRRHLDIAYRLGVRDFLVAVNKIDLVNFSKKRFVELESQVSDLFEAYPEATFAAYPTSGVQGDGVVRRGSRLRWFDGPTLLEALDGITSRKIASKDATVSVQFQTKIGPKRLYFAAVLGGSLNTGDILVVKPGNVEATITRLWVAGAEATTAHTGDQISFEVAEDRDIPRGAVLTTDPDISLSHEWDSTLIWLDDQEGYASRPYLAKIGHQLSRITLSRAWSQDTAGEKDGEVSTLATNGIYRTIISAQQDFALAPFAHNAELGRFVLIHPETAQTVAVGTVNFSLRRSENVHRHLFSVDTAARERATGHKGSVLWLTGLSGSGKSTIADRVSQTLHNEGRVHAVLDGDNLRTGINRDLGFTPEDRVENIRRTAEVAALMADAGLVVIVSLISPYRQDRQQARDIVGSHRFQEVFVSTALDVCEKRDPKGLYSKARKGEIPNFTGVNAPYEEPAAPDLTLDGARPLEELVSEAIAVIHGN